MEAWAEIPEFPGYSVSDFGWARNDDSGRTLVLLKNQHDVVHVSLMRDRVQYRRSITLLVARMFLPPHPNEVFKTPIILDGDPYNNHADNLTWRPHWFAVEYKRQFRDQTRYNEPIVDMNSGEAFDSYWAAAKKYGLLVREMELAMLNNTYVFPTFQRFARVPLHRYPLA